MENVLKEHEKVRDHYEMYPYPSYPWWLSGRWTDLNRVDLATWAILGPRRHAWIVGCGAISPMMFGRRNPEVLFWATDISSKSLSLLRRRLFLRGVHNVQLECADFSSYDSKTQFDAIDAYGVIHHTYDPEYSLSLLAKALRVGGVLRLMLYSKEGRQSYEKLRLEMNKNQKRPVNFKDLKKIAIQSGLETSKEIQSVSGLADAFLHPLVHVYDEHDLDHLLASCANLEVIRRDSTANHIIFLRKKS